MFLIIVDYKKPLEEVERYLAEHRKGGPRAAVRRPAGLPAIFRSAW